MKHDSPDSLLTTQPPGFSSDQACALALEHYGLSAQADSLWSERDQNFHLRCDTGEQYVLKIANHLEDPGVIDFQTRALEHISRTDASIPVPRTITNNAGHDYALVSDDQGRQHMMRLITWLDGLIVEESDVSEPLLADMGRMLARLGLALRDFEHPASHHQLLWDLKHAADLVDLLKYVDSRPLRELLATALERFSTHVVPQMPLLRSQVIHADLNRGNMLISKTHPKHVTGIIDFGDMVHTPLIMDLAIAAAYHIGKDEDPLHRALIFIRGYHEVLPVTELESHLLFDLMLARLCTSVTVQMWRAKLYPENEEYLLIHNDYSQGILQHALSFPRQEMIERIERACRTT